MTDVEREALVDQTVTMADGLVPGGLKQRELLVATALVTAMLVSLDLGLVTEKPTT